MLKKAGLSLVEIKRKMGKGIDDSLIGGLDDLGKGKDGEQMSGSGLRPIRAYAPVESQKSGDERTDGIDLLAKRVAEVVRSEVLRFFQRGEG